MSDTAYDLRSDQSVVSHDEEQEVNRPKKDISELPARLHFDYKWVMRYLFLAMRFQLPAAKISTGTSL